MRLVLSLRMMELGAAASPNRITVMQLRPYWRVFHSSHAGYRSGWLLSRSKHAPVARMGIGSTWRQQVWDGLPYSHELTCWWGRPCMGILVLL